MMFYETLLISLFVSSSRMESHHHSSSGLYHIKWKECGPCPADRRGTNEIFIDIHLSKRNRIMEFVGKTTLLIPFGDDISTNIDLSMQGTNAAWLPNYFNFQLTNTYSSFLDYLQQGWTDLLKSVNISAKCPIPKGIYEVKGYDVNNLLRRSLFPKEFIYGRYKVKAEFLKNKTVVGCFNTVIELIPDWQRKSMEHTTETIKTMKNVTFIQKTDNILKN